MGKLNDKGLKALIKKPPKRHPDGDGLFFRVAGQGKAYWTFRFTLNRRERETSIGPYPEVSLDQARVRHLELRASVARKINPVAKRAGKPIAAAGGVPTFGEMADLFIALNEGGWRNSKHHAQWVQTLGTYAAPIRSKPVNEITTADVLAVLQPIWSLKPETASRLRGRIEKVIAAAQVDGWIPEDRPNPARWRNWLDRKLPQPKKLGARGHHAAMPYTDLPAFMTKLGDIPGAVSQALQFTILTACRTGEVLGAKWNEINFDSATWSIPKERMKMGKPFDVPLSDQAIDILRSLEVERSRNPYVFAGRPMRPLSNMSMSMLMRRLGAGEFTVHGMRTSFRTWAGEVFHAEFEIAEHCLAHAVGNAASQAYNRTTLLERRRPVMSAWEQFVTGKDADNVVPLRRA